MRAMNCLFCPAVFETKPIETSFAPGPKLEAALRAIVEQEAEGGRWECVQVTVTRAGARAEVLSGYTCPDHILQAGATALVRT